MIVSKTASVFVHFVESLICERESPRSNLSRRPAAVGRAAGTFRCAVAAHRFWSLWAFDRFLPRKRCAAVNVRPFDKMARLLERFDKWHIDGIQFFPARTRAAFRNMSP